MTTDCNALTDFTRDAGRLVLILTRLRAQPVHQPPQPDSGSTSKVSIEMTFEICIL